MFCSISRPMKKIVLVICVILIAVLGVSAQKTAGAKSSNVKVFTEAGVNPLTQYALVEVLDDGTGVRFRPNMDVLLKSIGFKVMYYRCPSDYDDEMVEYLSMRATRKGKGGLTVVELHDGQDLLCTIDFANKDEVDNFVKSMYLSGYRQNDGLFSHPANVAGGCAIYVRVTGNRVRLMLPFEMLPYDF